MAAAASGKRGKSKNRPAKPSGHSAPSPYNPGAFLDLPPEAAGYETSAVVVLSMPLEESVSYGGGTAAGPRAILAASQQVELYDPWRNADPAMEYGIHTLPDLPVFAPDARPPRADEALAAIAEETARYLLAGKTVLGLGGEHTVSLGIARGVAEVVGDFTLVHIDAHADLRDTYEDNPLSHACVVRRIAELPQCEGIFQLGIRSTTGEQMDFVQSHAPGTGRRPTMWNWFARDMRRDKSWRKELRKAVKGRRVFFTFDVDGLDPAVVPATGTPEPDGLSYRQLLRIANIVAESAAGVPAMDCVELAPASGLHYADFTVSRALYEMLTLFMTRGGKQAVPQAGTSRCGSARS